MLQTEFTKLMLRYTGDHSYAHQLWLEVEEAYTAPERYFHTLNHLQHLLTELSPLQSIIKDWDVLLFAVFYHDIAYDVVQYVLDNDNEERSAVIAEKALSSLDLDAERIALCRQHILATKTHRLSSNGDTNIFIDADLSILGQPWETYVAYMKNIRKEYAIYPEPIYYAGRVKVLSHFLKTEPLFKTDHFHLLYEAAAKENMQRELEILGTM